jgi:hypothetical protein
MEDKLYYRQRGIDKPNKIGVEAGSFYLVARILFNATASGAIHCYGWLKNRIVGVGATVLHYLSLFSNWYFLI